MKKLLIILLIITSLFSKEITPNEVYGKVMYITDDIHFLLKHYGIDHKHDEIIKRTTIDAKLKPRNVWQLTYEILIKINILRNNHNLPTVAPATMAPVLNMSPKLAYEQAKRIITELEIFKERMNIESPVYKEKLYKGKSPIDVFNGLSHMSASMDEINQGGFTPSYVFAENIRVYDDITSIIKELNIVDKTIPAKTNYNATPTDTFNIGMKTLEVIKQLQINVGMEFVDFTEFRKDKQTPSEVFTITQMILAEIQTIKAFIGLDDSITPIAFKYNSKTPIQVDQLMSWNLRKLKLIKKLRK